MATSPLVEKMEYISIKVLIDGKAMQDTYDLLSVDVESAINAIPRASIILLLPRGEAENEDFAMSESEDFVPGAKVEIKVGYVSQTDTIFQGIIVRHGLKVKSGDRPQLVLHCQDEAVKLTVGKRVKPFMEQTDSAIIGGIIAEHGLSKDIERTTYVHPQLLQSGTTDWDFLVSRAEANGLLVYAEQGKVLVKKPLSKGTPDLELNYTRDVFDFAAELDAGYQLGTATASGWDFASGAFVAAKAQEPTINQHGDPTGKKMAEVLGEQDAAVQFTGPIPTDELKGIAEGMLLRSRLAAIRGSVTFFGNAKPKLNTLIKLRGFGKRFNGEALISSIRHTIREGKWRTETGFGLSPDWHHQKHGLGDGSKGLLPSVNGLQNGLVKQLHADPDGEHRILVSVPVLGADVWSRLGSSYAGDGHGLYCLPEVGDEVIVGFLNDDPRFAIILGSVYSSKNVPPYAANEKNTIKAIVTKSQLKVELNDADKVVTITTPGGNSIILSDADKTITVTDEHNNVTTMNGRGISLRSPQDITLEATGNVSISAGQKIDLEANGGDLTLKGLNVNAEGEIGAVVKGGASAELSAGGQTTVQGAMVLIN